LKPKLLVLLSLALVALTAGENLRADAAEIWTTANTTTISHNSFPQLKDNSLVWQARGRTAGATSGTDDWEIFLFDIDSQVIIQVTDDDYDDISPQTDGDYVVWQKHHTTRANQIYLYEVHGRNSPGGRRISSNDSMDHYAPHIAEGRIVWTSRLVAQSFEPGQIILYDARDSRGPEMISDNTFDCGSPRIDSETIVWTQDNGNGAATLFTYDLTSESPKPEPVPPGFVWGDSPQTDGDLTVLTSHDGTDREIFIYDASLKYYEQITDNDLEDRYPCVSGTSVTWVGGEGEDSEIFLSAEFHIEPPEPEPPSGDSGGGGGGACFVGTASSGASMNSWAYVVILSLMTLVFAALFKMKRACLFSRRIGGGH